MCLPGLSLLVSALFRWPCSISFHSAKSLLLGVLNSLSAGHAAFQFISQVRRLLLVCALFRWPCSISIHSSPGGFLYFAKQVTVRGLKAFCLACPPSVRLVSLCLPSCWSLCLPCLPSVSLCLRSCLPSCWSLSVLSPFCFLLSPFLSP